MDRPCGFRHLLLPHRRRRCEFRFCSFGNLAKFRLCSDVLRNRPISKAHASWCLCPIYGYTERRGFRPVRVDLPSFSAGIRTGEETTIASEYIVAASTSYDRAHKYSLRRVIERQLLSLICHRSGQYTKHNKIRNVINSHSLSLFSVYIYT